MKKILLLLTSVLYLYALSSCSNDHENQTIVTIRFSSTQQDTPNDEKKPISCYIYFFDGNNTYLEPTEKSIGGFAPSQYASMIISGYRLVTTDGVKCYPVTFPYRFNYERDEDFLDIVIERGFYYMVVVPDIALDRDIWDFCASKYSAMYVDFRETSKITIEKNFYGERGYKGYQPWFETESWLNMDIEQQD